jgi:hypothetical protein
MIRQELHQHRVAYSILITGLFCFAIALFGAWPNVVLQRYLAVFLSIFYFTWGVATHLKSQTITSRVVFEYGIVSALAGLLLCLMTL